MIILIELDCIIADIITVNLTSFSKMLRRSVTSHVIRSKMALRKRETVLRDGYCFSLAVQAVN